MIRRIAPLALAFLFLAGTAASAAGIVKGVVTRSDGAPAAGVVIKFTGQNVGYDAQEARSVTTDAQGRYEATNLAAKLWKYEIGRRGGPDGFASGIVRVEDGKTVEKNIQLR